jgi:hypothetical protein
MHKDLMVDMDKLVMDKQDMDNKDMVNQDMFLLLDKLDIEVIK